MERRIFGIENEYGVTCSFEGQRRLSPDEVARYLFRRVVSWGRSSNVFLRNGARLYLDVGSHPEYATPECDDIRQVVVHDKAGERILEGLVADAQQRLQDEGIAGQVYLFKNNTDSAGNSYGCHENYLVGRHGEFTRLADILIPFLVSRQIVCGAGKVLQTPRGAVYCVSQRAEVARLSRHLIRNGRVGPEIHLVPVLRYGRCPRPGSLVTGSITVHRTPPRPPGCAKAREVHIRATTCTDRGIVRVRIAPPGTPSNTTKTSS
jgi:hypothetical protein